MMICNINLDLLHKSEFHVEDLKGISSFNKHAKCIPVLLEKVQFYIGKNFLSLCFG